jgi:hypothetical protein
MASSSSVFLDFDLDQLLAFAFPFTFGVADAVLVGVEVVPLFGVTGGFGVDPLVGVDEALAASGGLEVLRILVDRRRGGFDEDCSNVFASPNAGVVEVVSGADLMTCVFPSFVTVAFPLFRHTPITFVHFCLRLWHDKQAELPA